MAKEVVFKIKLEGGEETIKTLNGIETEIKNIKDELSNTDIGSEKFKQLSTSLKSAESQLQNFTDNNLRSLSSLEQLEGGTKAFAGAIAVATGAFALFGVENEKAAQALVKLQGALALATGVKDLGEGFAKLGLTSTKVVDGFKNIGNVIKGNPILLLSGVIVSLLAATGQLDDIIQILGETFGEIFENIKPVLKIFGDLIQQAIDPLIGVLVPLVEVLGKALVPILNLALVPLQLLGEVLGALTPVFEVLGEVINAVIEPFKFLATGIGDALSSLSEYLGVSSDVQTSSEETGKKNQDLAKTYEKLKTANDQVNSASQFEIDLLKAKGVSIDEINKKELELAKTKKQQAIDSAKQIQIDAELELARLGNSEKDVTRREELTNLVTAAKQAETQAIRDEQLLQARIEKEGRDREKAAREKAAADGEKARQERLKKISESQKKELDLIKNRISDEQQELKNQSDEQLKQLRDNLTQRGEFGVEAEQTLANAQRDAAQKLLENQLALLNEEQSKVEENTKLNADAQAQLLEDLAQKEIDLQNQLSQVKRANAKTNAEEELKTTQEALTKAQEDLANQTKDTQIQITKETNDALTNLNQQFRNGEINDLETYEKEKQKILDDANKKTLQSNLTTAEENLKLAQDEQTKLLATQKEGSKEFLDVQADTNAKIKDAEAQLSSAQLAISENTSNQLVQNSNDANDEILKNLEDQIAAFQTLTNSIISLTQPLSENFNSLGLQISNTFAGIASDLPALFEKLNKPIADGLTNVEKSAAVAEKVAAAFQFAAGAIGEIGNLLANQSQERLNNLQQETDETITNIETQRDEQISAIEAQVEAGVLTKEQGDAQKLALQQQFDKQLLDFQTQQTEKEKAIKKRAFEQEKAIRIATAVAQGAAAALNAFAAGAVFGPITGGVFAGIAGAFAAVQIALIKNQKFPEGATSSSTPPSTAVSVPGATNLGAAAPSTFQGDIFGTGQSQQGTAGFGNTQGTGNVVRAYVVESDITSTTNRLDRIRTSSEL